MRVLNRKEVIQRDFRLCHRSRCGMVRDFHQRNDRGHAYRFVAGLLFYVLLVGSAFAQPVSIDAGGPGDSGFSGGSTYTVPANLMPVTILPPGTNDATMRFGPAFSYHVSVPKPGLYTVTLYFLEPTYQAPGQRVMAVSANDTPIIQGLDLAAESGYLVPTAKSGLVVIAGLDLYLNFSALGGHSAVVSMIVVVPTPYYLCKMGQLPPRSVLLSGLSPGINYMCGSYNLTTLADFGVSTKSCDAYLGPQTGCMWHDAASTAWGVINQRCTRCHGNDVVPGDVHLVDGLDLRTRASAIHGGGRGPAIVPGNSAASLMYLFMSLVPSNYATMDLSGDSPPSSQDVANLYALDAQIAPITAVLMPPFYPLQPAEIAALKNWIDLGAPDAQP